MRAEAENDAIRVLPSLCMAPRIDLVLQNAGEWWSWERRRKNNEGSAAPEAASEKEKATWKEAGAVASRRYYYVVCSANEDVASAYLRVISVHDLVETLERHKEAGELHLCRFFTTIEGGGSFWYQTLRYNLRHGAAHDAAFGVFAKDEVHKMCGVNTTVYSLGLNVPAVWMPSYTATPIAEESRANFIKSAMSKAGKSAGIGFSHQNNAENSVQDDADDIISLETDEIDDEEDDDADGSFEESPLNEETQSDSEEEGIVTETLGAQVPSLRKRHMSVNAEKLFPQVRGPNLLVICGHALG